MKIAGKINNLTKEQYNKLIDISHTLSNSITDICLKNNELSLDTLIYVYSLGNIAFIKYLSEITKISDIKLIELFNKNIINMNEYVTNIQNKNDDNSTVD